MALNISSLQSNANNPKVTLGFKPISLSTMSEAKKKDETKSVDQSNQAVGRTLAKQSSRPLLGLMLGMVLLLGLLFIGWSLWSAGAKKSAQSDFPPEYQRIYVNWAAERYSKTGSVTQLEIDLTGWQRDDMTSLLATMIRETFDAKTRQRLAALAEALRLPVAESSLLPAIFRQPGFVLGLVLTAVPILAAIALVILPKIRKPWVTLKQSVQETETNEALEDLLGDVDIEDLPTLGQEKKEGEGEDVPEEQKEGEQIAGLGDLASLFEEEDTSLAALEAFTKGLAEISADKLLEDVLEVAHGIRSDKRVKPSSRKSNP